ncbi:hypothetical protein D3C71_1741550 [compost metagenome]
MLDLGRVDVHAARDDHVRGAVADEQVAIGIEVAEVAQRDPALAVDGAARGVVVQVGEVRVSRLAHVDQAGLARRARLARFVEDAHAGRVDGTARRAGALRGVLGRGHGNHAGLARRIGLVDDRPEPFDHRPLDLGCARRAG